MGESLPVVDPGEVDACAAKLKILADPTRLAILRILVDGPKHVGEVNEVLALEPTLLSHHLRVLREAGLVEAQRDGKAVLYRIAPGVLVKRRGGTALDIGCCKLSFD
ncbi:MAG: transcriptional regulator [Pirellulaceae bacterium]|nr:MAG: transcriptional regulator [Pirellulaceae bacterium]